MRKRNPLILIKNDQGFTLVELMITMAITAVILLSVYAAYSIQSKSYSTQREVAKIQQDLRGALYMMEFDVLNAGRDPNLSNRYGLTDIRSYDYHTGSLDNTMLPAAFVRPVEPSTICFASFPVLEFTSLRTDTNNDNIGDAQMTIRYQVYDFNNDGRLDLGRRVNGGAPDLVAEGVVAVGYAFAYNPNPDGHYKMDRTAPAIPGTLGNVIWAADTNGDSLLDTNIDGTGDGEITAADDTDGNGVIDSLDLGGPLASSVDLRNIVAVRIWLLLQSERPSPENVIDRNYYVVGNRIIPPPNQAPFNDRYQRRVETVTLALRNFKKS